MSSSLGLAAFRIGMFIVLVSGILLLFEENGSAEQAITAITFLIGLVFLIAIGVWVRMSQRKS